MKFRFANVIVLTVIIERLAAPKPGYNVEALVHQLGTNSNIGFFAKLMESRIRRAQAHR